MNFLIKLRERKGEFLLFLYEGLGPILTTQYNDKTQEGAKSVIFYLFLEDFVVLFVTERLFCYSTKNKSCII